jgi:hypothetical protein
VLLSECMNEVPLGGKTNFDKQFQFSEVFSGHIAGGTGISSHSYNNARLLSWAAVGFFPQKVDIANSSFYFLLIFSSKVIDFSKGRD